MRDGRALAALPRDLSNIWDRAPNSSGGLRRAGPSLAWTRHGLELTLVRTGTATPP
jgi:hypothetical protein